MLAISRKTQKAFLDGLRIFWNRDEDIAATILLHLTGEAEEHRVVHI